MLAVLREQPVPTADSLQADELDGKLMAQASGKIAKVWKDPIVAELRAARETLLSESGNDLAALVARLRSDQERAGHQPITRPPRP